MYTHVALFPLHLNFWQCYLVELGPVGHIEVRSGHVAHVQ